METLKVGIIGCGHISTAHIKGWAKVDQARITAVFDLDNELAQRAAQRSGAKVSDSLESLLKEVDVVDVCTPPGTHGKIALQVAESGVHLLIEKPLVIDPADWSSIKTAADASGSKIAVLHNIKFTRSILRAKQFVESGHIGQLIRIERSFLTHPDSDRMLVGNTHWSHKLPGGRWFETLPHELYLTHFFAGPCELDHVTALHTDAAPPGAPADEVSITLRGNRCISLVNYSANCKQNHRSVRFIGTEGEISIDILSDAMAVNRLVEQPRMRPFGIIFLRALIGLAGAIPDRFRYLLDRARGITPHSRVIVAFASYLRGEGESPTPIEELDYVVKNCDAVGRAIDRQLAEQRDAA